MNLRRKNNFPFQPSLTLVLTVLLCSTQRSNCIVLDPDGGYSILVAVDAFEAAPEVPVLETLIASIKSDFTDLSTWIQSSTGKFYLKNVDILLQSHSSLVAIDATATDKSYNTADVQITEKVTQVKANNPNDCGLPGHRMTVPLNFFTDEAITVGGKSLLPHFARFRWGVFEEHGSSADPTMYPRFYRNSDESSWQLTVCSDTPLLGIFNASETEECNLADLNTFPPAACQFFPEPPAQQTAKSSLMNYEWLDNIQEFCDETTHNKLAPNIQNIMCQYRSVMEVIRSTADWSSVTETPANTEPAFRVLGTSEKPRLYLLLDRGTSPAPASVIENLATRIGTMLQSLDPTIIAAFGAFPSTTPGKSVDEIIPWSLLSDIADSAAASIAANLAQGLEVDSDFPEALLEFSRIVQANSHPQATVLAIIKVGPANSFENGVHEYDIASSLVKPLVQVHALEIRGNLLVPGVNLANIVDLIGGYHGVVTSTSPNQDIQLFLDSIEQRFQDTNIPLKNVAVIHKGSMSASREFHLGENMRNLQISVTAPQTLPSLSISVNGATLPITEKIEWNDRRTHGSRIVYQAVLENEEIDTPLIATVSHNCVDACDAYVVITGEPTDNGSDNELSSFEISTSSTDNRFVWTAGGSGTGLLETTNQPCHIYAKIPDSNNEVRVQATICALDDTHVCQTIGMVDDGLGEPDIVKNDDVYSATLIPPPDGTYRLQIHYTSLRSEDSLLLARTLDYDSLLVFEGVANFKPLVRRVIDMTVTLLTETEITLTWTAPTVYSGNTELLPQEYDLRYASAADFSQLLTNFEGCDPVPTTLQPPLEPGNTESVTFPYDNTVDMYYALRAIYSSSDSSVISPVSNLVTDAFGPVEVITEEPTTPEPTTPETTTPETTTPETTTPETTTPETTTPEPTTPETTTPETTTPETTTPETTTPETTTPETTTPETTTPETTTPETTTPETTTPETATPETTTPETTTPETTTPEPTTSTTPATTTIEPPNTVSTEAMSTTPGPERFFKRPIGYITASVGITLLIVGIGGTVGYLCWKRKRLIDTGRLKVV